ncbi:MAG: hypothetical protein ABEK59_09160 [Halobacteria archaeon]
MGKDWNNGLESEPVTTYVSEGTKEAWKKHADEMNVTLSRYVELMVNAGRTMYTDSVPEETEADRLTKGTQEKIREAADNSEVTVETIRGIYRGLEDDVYREVKELSDQFDVEKDQVYRALQGLIDVEAVDYDAMRNGYRRNVRAKQPGK